MASAIPGYISGHCAHTPKWQRKTAPMCGATAKPSSQTVESTSSRRPRSSTLCNAAISAMETVYSKRNAVPQKGGCAHILGRLASEMREGALSEISSALGAPGFTPSLHMSTHESVLAELQMLKIRKREEVVLGLLDDPSFTAPLRAHVLSQGGTVRWVTPSSNGTYAFDDITGAVGARTRLVALQLVSPLVGCAAAGPDDPFSSALRFVRGSGISSVLDITHALACGEISVPDLPAKLVVCGAAGVRGHPGAAIAIRNGAPRSANSVEDNGSSAACGETSTAAISAFAAAVNATRHSACGKAEASLSHSVEEALGRILGIEVLGGTNNVRDIPTASFNIPGKCAKEVAEALWRRSPTDAASVRLRVLNDFEDGRGKKKVHRPQLLCLEFSALVHDHMDVVRVMEMIGEEISISK